jgi:hypothetical protein
MSFPPYRRIYTPVYGENAREKCRYFCNQDPSGADLSLEGAKLLRFGAAGFGVTSSLYTIIVDGSGENMR